MEPSLPLPLEPGPPPEADDKRLWIGNINNRLTEYNLLKIVQKYGEIKKFDFLFHKTGPLKGQPRGYCFVTYETKEQAEKALMSLNGENVSGKNLSVKWAHTVPTESPTVDKLDASVTPPPEIKETKNILTQIRAIESKLKAMDQERDRELEACLASLPLTADKPLVLSARTRYSLKQRSHGAAHNRRDRKCLPYRKR